ncbi:aldehyde dehydrogenase family protein, partial [Luethyella okanaganae]
MPETTARECIRTGLFIGGEERWTAETLPVGDPGRSGEIVGRAASASKEDVADAVAAATAAFPLWAALSPQDRARLISESVVVSQVDRSEDARILSRENGKILSESLRDTSMLERRTRQTTALSDEIDRCWILPVAPGIPVTTEVAYQPLGVVTIIVPFNWPIGILSSALPHALLAGNTAIVKPPPSAPLATTRLVQRVAEK